MFNAYFNKTCLQGVLRSKCLSSELAGQGMAAVDPLGIPSLSQDPVYSKHIRNIYSAQKHAEKKGKGLWAQPSFRERLARRVQHNVVLQRYGKIKDLWTGIIGKLKWR